MINVISLGAGVQSSTMALMAAHGEITPMPECAIFADTGWEPKAVYTWLEWLEKQLPFKVHHVSNGDLREEQVTARMRKHDEGGKHYAALPYFTKADGSDSRGMVKRQCTANYKIDPIERLIKRQLLGLKASATITKNSSSDAVARHFRRRSAAYEAITRTVDDSPVSAGDGASNDSCGLPCLDGTQRLSEASKIGVYRMPVSFGS